MKKPVENNNAVSAYDMVILIHSAQITESPIYPRIRILSAYKKGRKKEDSVKKQS